jgi:hypothetical protein
MTICLILVLAIAGSAGATLTHYYKFEDNTAFVNELGTNGTFTGGPVLSTDRPAVGGSHSMYFDGINDEGDYAVQLLPASGNLTLSYWIKSVDNTWGAVASNEVGLPAGRYHFAAGSGYAWMSVYEGGTWASLNSTDEKYGTEGDVTDGVWHNVAITRSGNTWTLYVDGEIEDQETSAVTLATQATKLFRTSAGFKGLKGYLDELAVWDEALAQGSNGDPAGSSIRGVYTNGVVPEPATIAILGLGSLVLLRRRR